MPLETFSDSPTRGITETLPLRPRGVARGESRLVDRQSSYRDRRAACKSKMVKNLEMIFSSHGLNRHRGRPRCRSRGAKDRRCKDWQLWPGLGRNPRLL